MLPGFVLLLAAIFASPNCALAQAENSEPLQYAWQAGQKVRYEVVIEVDGGDYIERLRGTPLFEVTSAAGGVATVSFSGGLGVIREPKPEAGGRVSIPNYSSSFTGLILAHAPPRGQTLALDKQGEIVWMQGSSSLPFLLGDLSVRLLGPVRPAGERNEGGESHLDQCVR